MHLLSGDAAVIHVVLVIVEVKTMRLSSNALEERRASTARRAENNEHLARVHQSVHIAKDVNAALRRANDVSDHSLEFQRHVGDGLLVVGVTADCPKVSASGRD